LLAKKISDLVGDRNAIAADPFTKVVFVTRVDPMIQPIAVCRKRPGSVSIDDTNCALRTLFSNWDRAPRGRIEDAQREDVGLNRPLPF
jgi:hypothetical protein